MDERDFETMKREFLEKGLSEEHAKKLAYSLLAEKRDMQDGKRKRDPELEKKLIRDFQKKIGYSGSGAERSFSHNGRFIRCIVATAPHSGDWDRNYFFGVKPDDFSEIRKRNGFIILICGGEEMDGNFVLPIRILAEYYNSYDHISMDKEGHQIKLNLFATSKGYLLVRRGDGINISEYKNHYSLLREN
ncbi:MAG: hypothetical protein E3J72_05705 [Planctomycetota bacterium]|nr:MAG: hypothetical protein E3J72_05705 [Planctomycetota bacterium]